MNLKPHKDYPDNWELISVKGNYRTYAVPIRENTKEPNLPELNPDDYLFIEGIDDEEQEVKRTDGKYSWEDTEDEIRQRERNKCLCR